MQIHPEGTMLVDGSPQRTRQIMLWTAAQGEIREVEFPVVPRRGEFDATVGQLQVAAVQPLVRRGQGEYSIAIAERGDMRMAYLRARGPRSHHDHIVDARLLFHETPASRQTICRSLPAPKFTDTGKIPLVL